jgi:hypothetical protein
MLLDPAVFPFNFRLIYDTLEPFDAMSADLNIIKN